MKCQTLFLMLYLGAFLTFTTLWANSADDNFSKQIVFDICQSLFPRKINSKCHLLKIVPCVVKVITNFFVVLSGSGLTSSIDLDCLR